MRERSWSGISWAGLVASALAWMISTQLNYVFATVHCQELAWPRALTAVATLAVCIGGVALSWPAWTQTADANSVSNSKSRPLIAGISILGGAIFGLAIAGQGLALFFLGCAQ